MSKKINRITPLNEISNMAGLTVTTALTDLKVLFNDLKEVYFKAGEIKTSDLGSEALTMDMELPALDDGVTFDTGSADVTRVRITTKAVWTSKASKGDPDITFQVASVAGVVNDLLMENKKTIASATNIINGKTYKGAAYSLSPKKVTGALLMQSEDRQTIIILPDVEMYANFVAADGDNPAYFNVAVTPLENSEGAEIFILSETVGA